MKDVKSLCEYIFDYIKMVSVKTTELYRKDIVAHFLKIYGQESSTVRTSTDHVLKCLCDSRYIKRMNNQRTINSHILKGYYHFLKIIPADLKWKKLLYETHRK